MHLRDIGQRRGIRKGVVISQLQLAVERHFMYPSVKPLMGYYYLYKILSNGFKIYETTVSYRDWSC